MRVWRELPPGVRRVLIGDLLSAVGSGLILPFLFVYVSEVRNLGAVAGGLTLAALACGSIVANPLAGRAVDARGARPVLQVGLALAAAGDLALLNAHTPVAAYLAAALFGAGTGTVVPALRSLLGSHTPPEVRPTAFALQYALANVGLSVGALTAALIVSFDDPAGFTVLFALDAATYLAFAVVLVLPLAEPPGAVARGEEAPTLTGGYRQVLADARFRRLCVVNGLLVVCGFAQYYAALPAFAGRDGGLAASTLALVFAANTVVVASAQLPMLAATRGVLRTRLVAGGAACFALCWLLVPLSAPYGSGWQALLLVAIAAGIFGLGETMLSPALGPLVNELAPEHLRGRYNAVDTLVLSAGTVVGPALAGWALAGGTDVGLFFALAVGCLLAAALTRGLRSVSVQRAEPR